MGHESNPFEGLSRLIRTLLLYWGRANLAAIWATLCLAKAGAHRWLWLLEWPTSFWQNCWLHQYQRLRVGDASQCDFEKWMAAWLLFIHRWCLWTQVHSPNFIWKQIGRFNNPEARGYNHKKTGFDEAVMEDVAWHSLANRQFSLSAQSRDDFCFTLVNVNQWDDGASKLRIKYKVNWNRSSAENSHTRYSAITSLKMPSRQSWATPDELPGFHFLLIHFVFWGQPLRFVQNLLQNELQCCLLPGSAALVGNTGLAQWPCCLVTSS